MNALVAMVSGEQLLNALLYVVIWGAIMWVLWWGLEKIAPQEPWKKVGNVALVLITVVVLVNILLGLVGRPIIQW